jgi:DNA-binding ferritin-like protein
VLSAVPIFTEAGTSTTRPAINQSDEISYRDTADIFIEISRGTDQYLWFVEAPLGVTRLMGASENYV